MRTPNHGDGPHRDGPSLRQAAVIVGFGYLLMPVAYAEYSIFPKMVIPNHIEQTVSNISTHPGLFRTAMFCYFIAFLLDIPISWALYILLTPVNRSFSLLTAWFRLISTAVALFAWLNLVSVYRLVTVPEYLTLFGPAQLNAQVDFLLHSFHYDWSMSLIIFGIHLILLGYLIARSRYIPWIIGILLVINGLGWIIDSTQPYLFPNAHLGFVFITFFGELVFMLWLLIRGWKIQQPTSEAV